MAVIKEEFLASGQLLEIMGEFIKHSARFNVSLRANRITQPMFSVINATLKEALIWYFLREVIHKMQCHAKVKPVSVWWQISVV